jgi:IS30 family transposase
MIEQRPPGAENRSRFGHLEGDTVIGTFDKHCILTLVCRKSGHLMIAKLYGPNHRRSQPAGRPAASRRKTHHQNHHGR